MSLKSEYIRGFLVKFAEGARTLTKSALWGFGNRNSSSDGYWTDKQRATADRLRNNRSYAGRYDESTGKVVTATPEQVQAQRKEIENMKQRAKWNAQRAASIPAERQRSRAAFNELERQYNNDLRSGFANTYRQANGITGSFTPQQKQQLTQMWNSMNPQQRSDYSRNTMVAQFKSQLSRNPARPTTAIASKAPAPASTTSVASTASSTPSTTTPTTYSPSATTAPTPAPSQTAVASVKYQPTLKQQRKAFADDYRKKNNITGAFTTAQKNELTQNWNKKYQNNPSMQIKPPTIHA